MFRKIIKIFIASPGDLADERRAAQKIVQEENANHANGLGYHLELVGWEDTVSQSSRAQEAINKELDQCDYFVGMMWKRWGTPPGLPGHPYTSGFEEEYSRSDERRQKTGKPEISLLLKKIASDSLADPGPDATRVLKFRKKVIREKKYTFQEFDEPREFENRFRAVIARFLNLEVMEDRKVEDQEAQKPAVPEERAKQIAEVGPFVGAERDFLQTFLSPSEAKSEPSAAAVARFRLIGTSFSAPGTDDVTLGIHDSNLIYRDLREEKFSQREISALIHAGVENFRGEVVPLWHWLTKAQVSVSEELAMRTIYGGDLHRANAFRLLGLLNGPLQTAGPTFDRAFLIKFSSGTNSPEAVRLACLEYLASRGNSEDLQYIQPILDDASTTVVSAAIRTKLHILLKTGLSDAYHFLAGVKQVDIGEGLASLLIQHPEQVATSDLRACLDCKTSILRRNIAQELYRRGELTADDTNLLLSSDDAETRLIGALAARKFSSDYRPSHVRNVLVKPHRKSLVTLLSGPADLAGEDAYSAYQRNVFGEMKIEELRSVVQGSSFYFTEALEAAYLKYYTQFHDEIVANLRDKFASYFANKRSGETSDPGDEIVDYKSKKLVQTTLEIVCEKGGKSDLAIVREVLDENPIEFDERIVSYLRKHGDWRDANRILALTPKVSHDWPGGLLSSRRPSDAKLTADAILALGSDRIADALALEMSTEVRSKLISGVSKKQFSSFDDSVVLRLFAAESDSLRKVAVLKAVSTLSKGRLSRLLHTYQNHKNTYYYNVVFWLDLGVSMPAKLVSQVAALQLNSSYLD